MMRQCDLGDTPYEIRIPGHAREIALRIYRPGQASIDTDNQVDSVEPSRRTARARAAARQSPRLVPVVLYFHGGLFTRGSLDDADATAVVLARVPALVVSVDYSLAPAYPFPAALEDAYHAACWIAEHAHEFGADMHRIGVAGHDAGGNLATCLCAIARDRGGVSIAAQVLLAPLLDPSMTRVADARRVTSDVDVSECAQCYRAYLPHASQRLHPYAAPLESRRQHRLPPALIASAEHDVLHVEAEKYAGKLINVGVPTQVTRFASVSHTTLATYPPALAAIGGLGGVMVLRDDLASQARAANAPSAPEVDVAPVVARTITDWQSYSGRLEAIEKVDIRALVSGTIVAVHFKDGQLVKKGDPLFTIDPRPYQAEVDRAQAQLAAAQARNAYASTDQARAQRLIVDNAISRRDYDEKNNAAREAAANLKAARAALETARLSLGYTRIVAPVSGRVSRAEMTVGNIVSAGAGSPPLTTLVSVTPIYASFDVDEQTYLQYLSRDVHGGGSVSVQLGLANEVGYSRNGVIASIDNRLDTASGTIRVRARFDNVDGSLLPGLYARVKVGGGAPHPAVMIGDSAIGTDQDKKYVLVVTPQGRAEYREVQLGNQQDGLRVITKGLKPGERIVVNGLQRVHPGELVKVNAVQMTS